MKTIWLTVPVTFTFADDGHVDREAIEGNVAAAIETWVHDGRITPDGDDAHATLTGWSVGGENHKTSAGELP